jgi:hypothetical protein
VCKVVAAPQSSEGLGIDTAFQGHSRLHFKFYDYFSTILGKNPGLSSAPHDEGALAWLRSEE